ncbi:MAG: hypothetical protein JWM46_700 [Candidatus Kaiserbacteria bacterium]|nr:hypothetical protein [Candidatus Kaiserbacteria bacterium]
MRITIEKGVKPILSPMVPPKKPLDLEAWNNGFCGTTRKWDVEAAKSQAEQLKEATRGAIRVISKPGFVFAFIPAPNKEFDPTAILWATARNVRAIDIRPVLRQECRV